MLKPVLEVARVVGLWVIALAASLLLLELRTYSYSNQSRWARKLPAFAQVLVEKPEFRQSLAHVEPALSRALPVPLAVEEWSSPGEASADEVLHVEPLLPVLLRTGGDGEKTPLFLLTSHPIEFGNSDLAWFQVPLSGRVIVIISMRSIGNKVSTEISNQRLLKLLLKGIGFSLGFPNTSSSNCVMRRAYNLSDLDRVPDLFCAEESEHLAQIFPRGPA